MIDLFGKSALNGWLPEVFCCANMNRQFCVPSARSAHSSVQCWEGHLCSWRGVVSCLLSELEKDLFLCQEHHIDFILSDNSDMWWLPGVILRNIAKPHPGSAITDWRCLPWRGKRCLVHFPLYFLPLVMVLSLKTIKQLLSSNSSNTRGFLFNHFVPSRHSL